MAHSDSVSIGHLEAENEVKRSVAYVLISAFIILSVIITNPFVNKPAGEAVFYGKAGIAAQKAGATTAIHPEISVEIPMQSVVSVHLYTILGNGIHSSAPITLDEGNRTISLNDVNLSNGVYLYRLEMTGIQNHVTTTQTGKITIK